MTAGNDGFVRFWDALAIDQCEGDDNLRFYIKPSKEIYISSQNDVSFLKKHPANILNIQCSELFWIVQDSFGKLYRLDVEKDFEREEILSMKVGRISDMAVLDKQPGVLS